jgi:hypothetical protein
MNEKTEDTIMITICLILIFLMMFGFIRAVSLTPNYHSYCELKYGKYYFCESISSRIYSGQACININENKEDVIDEIILIKESDEEIRKFCNTPLFFQLNKWGNDC